MRRNVEIFLPVPESSRTKSEHWDILSLSLLKKSDLGLSGTNWFILNFLQLIEAASGSRASNKRSGSSTPVTKENFGFMSKFAHSVGLQTHIPQWFGLVCQLHKFYVTRLHQCENFQLLLLDCMLYFHNRRCRIVFFNLKPSKT